MRRSRFGVFLNEWGRTLARYGSGVPKFVEKGGKLTAEIVSWNSLIVDAVQFEHNPVIEILWFTPAQLRKNKSYDQEIVEKLIDTVAPRETMDGQQKDNKANYIKLYEVHGELPLSLLTDDEKDNKEYRQQMQVVSFSADKTNTKKFNDFVLFRGKEAKSPYMITHLIKEDGRTQSIGAVEHLFEPQWMTNHNVKKVKDSLDLSSQMILQSSDGSFVGRNVLNAIENGQIMIHALGQPMTQINTSPNNSITALQNFTQQWTALGRDITSTSGPIRGETQPSGTAWRQVEALRTESHSLFEIMRENKGLAVEDMLRIHIIPFIKKQLRKKKSIIAELSQEDSAKIDMLYINNLVKDELDKIQQRGEFIDVLQVQREIESAKEKLNVTGSRREQEFKKGLFDDYEWETEFEITNESINKDAVLTTLSTVFTTIASNPAILQDPNARMVFNQILEETGTLSPIEFSNNVQPGQPTPQPGQPGAGGLTALAPANANNKVVNSR